MKRIVLIWMAVLLGFSFSSCDLNDDDHYSLGKFWLSYGVIEGESSAYHLKLDNGEVLFPAATAVPNFSIEDGKRVLVNYTILDESSQDAEIDFLVKINWMESILTKDIIELTETNADSIGNDPLNLNELWLGGGFLNVNFSFDGGSTTHLINLVQVEEQTPDAPVKLELRHNRMEDPHQFLQKGVASFRLESIQLSGQDSVEFELSVKGYDEEIHTFNGTYHY